MLKFWREVDKKGPNDCWIWTACRNKYGYGRFGMGGTKLAHRVAYCLHRNIKLEEIKEKCVCHSCDNPPCCNPVHLWLGSNADNMRDRDHKGRGYDRAGEKNVRVKLTNNDVRSIRAWLKAGYTQQAIARPFDVSRVTVTHIHTGYNWKHLLEEPEFYEVEHEKE